MTDLYAGEFEIASYQTGLWWARDARSVLPLFLGTGTYRTISCQTVASSSGVTYHIGFWFSDDVTFEDTSIGSVIRATDSGGKEAFLFLITPPESYYQDVYTIIQNERPVYFLYHTDKAFPPPMIRGGILRPELGIDLPDRKPTRETVVDPVYCKVLGFRIATGLEPVGEGIDIDTLKQEKAFGDLFEKMGLKGQL